MIRKKETGKESTRLGLGFDISSIDSPAISTLPAESSIYESSDVPTEDTIKQSEVRKKQRRKRKNRDSQTLDFPDNDVIRSVQMLESDVVMVTDSSMCRSKEGDVQNSVRQSIPVESVYVENERGFKAVNNISSPFMPQNELYTYDKSTEQRILELAILSDRCMYNFCVICRGLLGGTALCQLISLVRTSPPQSSWNAYLERSSCDSQIFHSCWYFLLIVCTIFTFDRIDIKSLKERSAGSVFGSGLISLVIYLVSLCVTLSFHGTQMKVAFYSHSNATILWNQDGGWISEMEAWKTSRLAVSVCVVIGWLLVAISTQPDDIPSYLKGI